MFRKKLFMVMLGIGATFTFFTTEASAEAIGKSENFKVDAQANQEAITFVKEHGGLENSPVPAENLTTQQPIEATFTESRSGVTRAVKKRYSYSSSRYVAGRFEYRCNYLAPAGFTWNDNGIPSTAMTGRSGNTFLFGANVRDTGIGGYGTGGWYWRKFATTVNNQTIYYWLSAWNYNHLVYG